MIIILNKFFDCYRQLQMIVAEKPAINAGNSKENRNKEGTRQNRLPSKQEKIMRFVVVFAAAIAMLASLASCGKGPKTTEQVETPEISATLKPSTDDAPLVKDYRSRQISLSDRPDEELSKEPAYRSEKPQYGTLAIGSGPDQKITIVVDEAENEDMQVYIDGNNDEDLTNDVPPQWRHREGRRGLFGAVVQVSYSTPGGVETLPYRMSFFRMAEQAPDAVFYFRSEFRQGEINLDGQTRKISIFEEDGDGLFSDLSQNAFFIDIDNDGKFGGGRDSHEYFGGTEPFTIKGSTYRLVSVNSTGTEARIKASEAAVPAKANLMPGNPAVEFTSTNPAGNKISLSDYRDKVVLLDFWATWCGPCVDEIPNMKEVYKKYKDKDFVILGISLDIKRENLDAFLEKAGIDWPQVYDGGGWKNEVAQLYRVTSIPSTFLVDRKGIIRDRNLRGPALEVAVKKLMGAPAIEKTAAGESS
jgi:peroxiredoxin